MPVGESEAAVGTGLAFVLGQVIRISTRKEESCTVVIIDGKLASADLGAVDRIRRSLPDNVVLDLGGLDGCADDGIRLLRDWLKSGARLINAAPFLRMVLVNTKMQPSNEET